MIRLESQPTQKLDPRVQSIASRLLFIQFALFFVNAAFSIVLWLRYTRLLLVDDSFIANVRLYLFLSMLLLGLLGLRLVRKHRKLAPPIKIPEHDGAGEVKNGRNEEARFHAHHRWVLFERSVAYLNIGVVIAQTIRFDVFQWIFSFGVVHEFISTNPFLGILLDRLTELALLCDYVYLCVKLPRIVGDLIGTFGRFYVGKWRVHESVFGLLWVMVGAAFLIFGTDGFDHLIGGLYILFGAFIIGRDYQDVRNFEFFEKVAPTNESPGEADQPT